MSNCIFLCATMDTKFSQATFLKKELESQGLRVLTADIGMLGESPAGVDFSQRQLLGENYERVINATTRTEASFFMKEAIADVTKKLFQEGIIQGIISIGGSGGASIACHAMHQLPIGFPKMMVTPNAAGDVLPYTNGEDIIMLNSIVDVQNLNFISTFFLRQAARIMGGLVKTGPLESGEKECIAITCFGVTTPCVEYCTKALEESGYEVVVFASRGKCGGAIMEKMILENRFSAVLDITTSEIADEIAGGIYSSGPNRLKAAVAKGIPYIVVPGALEMINFGPKDTLTTEQLKRTIYVHSPGSAKMRMNKEEMATAGKIFAERLAPNTGNVCVLIPNKGFSEVNKEGKVFFDPEADAEFVKTLKTNVSENVQVLCFDNHINDEEFAAQVIESFKKLKTR